MTGATVSRLQWQDGQVANLTYQQGAFAGKPVPFWVERNPLLSTETVEYFGAGDRVYSLAIGSAEALSLTCTHQGCTVQQTVSVNEEGTGYVCPCYGAVYGDAGEVLGGPARENLTRYRVLERSSDQVQLVAIAVPDTATTAAVLEADYYVLAADIPGIKHLLSLSEGSVEATVAAQVDGLQVTDPFAIGRFWFDRDFDWEHSLFASLSGYRLTDSITLYHRIQEDYIAWAKRTGGSVVEIHAYCYKEKDFPTQEALLATFESELYDIVPTLKGSQILHKQLVNQKNFAGFPPGSFRDRPTTATPVPNLMFAGDWVKMPFPCGFMERAVSIGLLAANTIL
ncbi:MAG: FAD-dependent oxidoreductase [Cyanobacteria bacterium P01_H01_bin.58]